MTTLNKTKLILVIELEMERDVPDIANEVCKRIAMHPHVHDANPVSISPSMESEHAPKPQPNMRNYMGMPDPDHVTAKQITERLAETVNRQRIEPVERFASNLTRKPFDN